MTGAGGPLLLLVEDEARFRRFLRVGLEGRGYRVLEAPTGRDAIRAAAEHVPDIVLLDLGLPDLDGLEVLARLREWTDVPVVVVSAREREGQKVAALDAGADDYVTKPFGLAELLARLRVAERHGRALPGGRGASVFTAGDLEVDLAARRVRVADREIRLTPIEYRLLQTLVRHAGKVVTHRQVLEAVWGPGATEQAHTLRVHMAHLRRKLEDDPARPRRIRTETGVGYRLEDAPSAGPPS